MKAWIVLVLLALAVTVGMAHVDPVRGLLILPGFAGVNQTMLWLVIAAAIAFGYGLGARKK